MALSRATSLQGLQVLGFNPEKVNRPILVHLIDLTNPFVQVMAHPKVAKWSQTLETIN